jgi:hypothetical protein
VVVVYRIRGRVREVVCRPFVVEGTGVVRRQHGCCSPALTLLEAIDNDLVKARDIFVACHKATATSRCRGCVVVCVGQGRGNAEEGFARPLCDAGRDFYGM